MAELIPPRMWTAQAGSQVLFLSCPIFEVLFEGTRGPGKTDALLMDFAQHCGQGYGSSWRGILFRETYPQLADVVAKSKAWFPLLGAEFNESKMVWKWPTGEELLLRHMRKKDDYWNYHGHSYPWIGWEELTNWATSDCYLLMMSCSRSTVAGMPRKYRSTTNPYGKGHNWVKKRFQLPHARGKIIRTSGEPDRVAIHGNIIENRILLDADPEYINRIRAAASNPAQVEAWLNGSWEITSGGMFDDLWATKTHVFEPFPIPKAWTIDRAFDWGSSKPFSVGWWAESNGEEVILPNGRVLQTVKGDLFRIAEWYGCEKNQENVGLRMLATQVGEGIRMRELAMGLAGRVKPGPADSSIFDEENGNCIAKDLEKAGAKFVPADKGPGSRKQGWEMIRKRLEDAKKPSEGVRERPGLFVFSNCKEWLRCVPPIPRDEDDLDDVDTEVEDHNADETRYRVRYKRKQMLAGGF